MFRSKSSPTSSDPRRESEVGGEPRLTGSQPPSGEEFRRIYDQYVGLVQFVLRPFRLRDEEQQELIQEVFLRVYQNWGRYDQDKIKGFLAVTARNLAVDLKRKEQSQKTDLVAAEDMEETPLWEQNPRRISELMVAERFIEEVAQTPGGECFGMFYRDGIPVKEIADKLGESVGTITSRLARLRVKFKDRLREHLDKLD